MKNLGTAIVRAADSAHQELAPTLGFSSQGTPSRQQIYLLFELLYLFSHLTLRAAVSAGLMEPQLEKLQAYLGPLLSSVAVDSFFLNSPEDLKRNLKSEYYENLNKAELAYANCRALMSEDNPFDPKTIIGKLANTVATLWQRPSDTKLMTSVISATISAFNALEINQHMSQVASVIDQVSLEALQNSGRLLR